MASINDLPENVLLELFSLVPARELLRHCRLVCSLWRDLIDLVSLWKRKCQREGFISENWDQPVADWKVFYFLCSLQRNLIRNPCAQEGLKFWTIDQNGGDKWKVEDIPGAHGRDFPDPRVKKYFVTSYHTCLKSQMVDLQAEGYWKELMDTVRPDIIIKDWFAARYDCGCRYQICVQLLSADYLVLDTFEPPAVEIEQWSDFEWREVSHTFSNYPPGVRHIRFQHGGKDTQYWAGWYGPRVTNSSITIGPEVTRKPSPTEGAARCSN
ncbi:F-box only protein 6-like [Trichosurus vulpecula]|uniref:F-box only protein 6-like n=1 Tax=Trichosurus vulpecula TaxID=9337 RepID=UPI00186B0F9D|nr:F-box only protein 6-like [Trichosurus vulpecula]XP_036598973.1 F-box only protein 6-like [Trichosurus vulpecula]XP_036598974.1 F-box only protein 6-like [Trichosurus vulpecula]